MRVMTEVFKFKTVENSNAQHLGFTDIFLLFGYILNVTRSFLNMTDVQIKENSLKEINILI